MIVKLGFIRRNNCNLQIKENSKASSHRFLKSNNIKAEKRVWVLNYIIYVNDEP